MRDTDRLQVVLKQVSRADHPFEEGIHRFLSAPGSEMSQDPTNHCIPLLDVLHPPNDSDLQILVMQLLRKCDSPPFDTFGEVVDFFNQIFEVSTYLSAEVLLRSIFIPGFAIYA